MIHYICGLLIGLLYGLFFVDQRRRAFLDQQKMASIWRTFVLPTIVRLVLFSLIWVYLLITEPIHFILTMACFITGFWISILRKKATSHGRV